MIVLGIDPGKHGGVVLLDGRRLLYSRPADGPAGYMHTPPKTDPDPGDFMALWDEVIAVARPELVLVEAPSWHAGAGGRMSAGVAGRSGMEHACWRMLCAVHGVPYEVLAAKTWRKRAGIVVPRSSQPRKAAKAATIAKIRSLLPDLDLMPGAKRTAHDGLADAAGMALGGGT